MRYFYRTILILFCGLTFLYPAIPEQSGKTIQIKLATLAPKGSPWFDLLEEIRAEWLDISDGRVDIRLYAGGGFGDEGDIITKLRLNQIQAAAVSTKGLGVIDQGVWAFSLPTLFESEEQLEWVRHQLRDEFVRRFDEAGVKLVFWSDLGWSYWFCRVPVRTPDDLRKLRIFNWSEVDLQRVWKAAGFHAVRLSSIDTLPGLQTGLIDCFATSPLMAATFQWFGLAKNMTRLKWGAMVGGIVVSNQAWDRIPADLQPQLLEAAERRSTLFQQTVRDLDAQAIEVMEQYGLQVIDITAEEEALWRASIAPYMELLRGHLVPEDMYDRIIELRSQIPDELTTGY
jgi:TRAP-type C4-dicarboxylate transport system substrate-binding protein